MQLELRLFSLFFGSRSLRFSSGGLAPLLRPSLCLKYCCSRLSHSTNVLQARLIAIPFLLQLEQQIFSRVSLEPTHDVLPARPHRFILNSARSRGFRSPARIASTIARPVTPLTTLSTFANRDAFPVPSASDVPPRRPRQLIP